MTLVEIFAAFAPNKYIFVVGFGFLVIGILTWLIAVHWGGIDGKTRDVDDEDEDDISESDIDLEYEAQKEKTRKEKEALENEKAILDMEKAFLTELEEVGRVRKQEEKQEEEYKQEEEKRQKEYDKKQKEKTNVGFDWHNGQNAVDAANTNVRNKSIPNNANATLNKSSLNKKPLQTDETQKKAVFLGVLVNLVEEKFSDNEIARAIVSQNGNSIPGENLLHTIEAVRSFVDAGETVKSDDNGRQRSKFGHDAIIGGTRVVHKTEIPVNDNRERFVEQDIKAKEKSLKNLLNGDVSSAVNVLEKEIKRQEKTGKTMKNGPKRKALYKDAAELACHAGTLAVMVDTDKAMKSFKLAIFLNPESADGHSRYGDLCFNLGLNEKAEKAFINVRKLADEENEKRLIANANDKLGGILISRGEKEKAEKRRRESAKLFKELGFTAELNKQEQKATTVLKEAMQKQLMNAG
ncbi:MAG: hypothetical protein KAJ75_00045 [Alphaproteobacteria bacterium]|nr:hypothetical protein [Alphaproteobacteria bacterium]